MDKKNIALIPTYATLLVSSVALNTNVVLAQDPPPVAQQQQDAEPTQKDRDAYFANYTFCDAEVLGKYWNQSSYEAKLRAMKKLGWNNKNILDSELTKARKILIKEKKNPCNYSDENYTYEDAEKLANKWKLKTPYDAKLKMNELLLKGKNNKIKAALK